MVHRAYRNQAIVPPCGGGMEIKMRRKSFFKSRKFKYGSAATVFTVFFIAVVILFNVIFSALSSKYGWYVDMTNEAVFSLSDAAKDYVSDIKADVNIYFASEPDELMANDDMRYVYTTAKQLEDAVDGVSVDCVDIVKNPAFFEKFYSTSATIIEPTSVVVESGSESKVLTSQSFFVYDEDDQTNRWGYQGEYRFVSAIMQVTQSETPIVYFTTEHGEDISGAQTLARLFSDCGFEVKTIDLSTEDIDDDCRIIVIYNPIYDFLGIEAEESTSNEITKIDSFLDNFGGLLVFEDSEHSDSLNNLNEFLKEWGISYRAKTQVKDSSHSLTTDGYSIFAEYQSDETLGGSFYSDITSLDTMPKAVIRESMPIDILWDTGGDLTGSRKVSAMLKSYEGSELMEDGKTAETGAYNLLTMSLETRIIDNERYYSYVMAAGSPTFGSNNYLVSNAYGNSDIIYSAMKFVGRDGILAELDMKPFDDTTLTITTAKANAMTAQMTLILPVVISAVGVVVIVRRKHS